MQVDGLAARGSGLKRFTNAESSYTACSDQQNYHNKTSTL